MVSVIMSVYNEDLRWLRLSVESILCQTYREIEFVVVCDNPQNISAIQLFKEYAKKDNRLTLIINKSNIGLTKSLNIALGFCHGEYIARMDADDISNETRIQKQVDFLDANKEIGFIGCYYSVIDETGRIIKKERQLGTRMSSIFITNPICHPSVMFRKELLEKREPFYNEDFKSSQDYELWTFLVKEGVAFANIPEVLLSYRISDNQVTAHKKKEQSNYMRMLRRELIHWYLLKENVSTQGDFDNLESLISKVSKAAYNSHGYKKENLLSILYSLYYSSVVQSTQNALFFISDKNFLFYIYPIKMSLKLLCAKQHRDVFLGY